MKNKYEEETKDPTSPLVEKLQKVVSEVINRKDVKCNKNKNEVQDDK